MSFMIPFHHQHHHHRRSPPVHLQQQLPLSELPVTTLLDLGHEQAESGNYTDARCSFQHAVIQLQHDQKSSNASSIDGYQLAVALSDLGHCCYQLQLLQEAATHWQEALRLKRHYYYYTYTTNIDCSTSSSGSGGGMNKNLDLARALENLGQVLKELGDYSSSKRYYNEALDMKRLVYGKEQQQSSTSTTSDHSASSAGCQHHQKMGMKQQVYGYDRAQNSDVAATLTALGDLAHASQHYHKACKHYTDALEMVREQQHDHDNDVVPHLLYKLGLVHADTGKQLQSQCYFDQALVLAERIVGAETLVASIRQQQQRESNDDEPPPPPVLQQTNCHNNMNKCSEIE